MENKPLISVITPCYNGEKFLDKYFQGLLCQTYKNLEVIFINDGSTDRTEEIALSYGKKLEEQGMTFIYKYQQNAGQASAVNVGLKLFTGEYVTWPDSDDWLHPLAMERRVKFLEENKDFGFVYCETAVINEKTRDVFYYLRFNNIKGNMVFDDLLEERLIACPVACFVRASCLLDVIPDRQIFANNAGQNWQLLLPLAYKYKCGFIYQPLAYYLLRENSHSRSDDTYQKQIDKTYAFEEMLFDVFDKIDMDKEEREKHIKFVKDKYAYQRLVLASKKKDVLIATEAYNVLKNLGTLTVDKQMLYANVKSKGKRLFIALQTIPKRIKAKMKKEKSTDVIFRDKCSGCLACKNACPVSCISIKTDKEGFGYPVIDKTACINCGLCQKICPVINKAEKEPFTMLAFACKNKDEAVIKNSSSGGAFTALAEKVIEKGGVVFGATFIEENKKVTHIAVDKKEDLIFLRGSKYLQSDVSTIYKSVEGFLKQGRLVLFSGTPCQVGGLKKYLRKEYENLILQDVACFGVPSRKMQERYVLYLERKHGKKVTDFSFRDKGEGWKNYCVSVTFEDGEVYKEHHAKNLYMKLFLSRATIRPSCYDCSFKGENHVADVTLADFWGIEKVLPEMDDNKGTSLVIINTKKGESVFEEVKGDLTYKPCAFEDAVKDNPMIMQSAIKPKVNRKKVFKLIDGLEIEDAVKVATKKKIPLKERIKGFLSKVKRKIKK